MQVYHFNHERMSESDIFAASLGTANKQGADLFRRLMREGAYTLVAEVEGDHPEQAWIKTQNGVRTDSWSLEPLAGLTPLGLEGDMGHRSSMVGDIVVINDIMHVADMIGFVEIGPMETEPSPAATSPKP